jgi:hypothetical protein
MAWVRFRRNFDFTPAGDRRATVAYRAGTVANVTRECVVAAVTGRKAVRLKAPPVTRDEATLVSSTRASGPVRAAVGTPSTAFAGPPPPMGEDL